VEIAAVGEIEQTARRIEYFAAMSAAHETAAQRELRGLKAEDCFAEGTARRKSHIEPGAARGC
jgi:hypothetical protein